MDFYDDKDHKKLSDFVKWKLRCKWIMSYDDTANIRDLYAGLRQKRLQILYSASSATKGSELMIFSKDIQLPDNYEKMHLSFLSKKVSSGDMEAHHLTMLPDLPVLTVFVVAAAALALPPGAHMLNIASRAFGQRWP